MTGEVGGGTPSSPPSFLFFLGASLGRASPGGGPRGLQSGLPELGRPITPGLPKTSPGLPGCFFTGKADVSRCWTTPERSRNQAGTRTSLGQLLPTKDVSSHLTHLITVTRTVGGGGGRRPHGARSRSPGWLDAGPPLLGPPLLIPPHRLDTHSTFPTSHSVPSESKPREAPVTNVTFARRLSHRAVWP